MSNPEHGTEYALECTKSTVFNDTNFKKQWDALLPADKVILSMIAYGSNDLHGQSALSEALEIGNTVNKNTPQMP